MLYGFLQVILQGVFVILEFVFSLVVFVVLIGLVGVGVKLLSNCLLVLVFEGYIILICGVFDLVLMLLIFYGLQIVLNSVIDVLGMVQFDIDLMIVGIIIFGFIYGVYFMEIFCGVYFVVLKGYIEVVIVFGFSGGQMFWCIFFLVMMCYVLLGIGNNWQVIFKVMVLVLLLGLEDVVKVMQLVGKSIWQLFYFVIVCGLIYLVFIIVFNGVLLLFECCYIVGVKRVDL